MYHIVDDKRAKESALKIYKGLRIVLKTKSLQDVTITDIKNECGVSRSTFYRLFDNVVDVLEMQLSIFFDQYVENQKKEKDSLLYFYQFFDKHSELIYLISTQNSSIINRVMATKISPQYLFNSDVENEYLLVFKCGIMSSLLCKWVERNKKETPAEMAKITREILSKNVVHILTKL